jgi:hypothetical protein
LIVGEQDVMDGRQESQNGNKILLDRKVSGRQRGVASWIGQGASEIEKVRGKQQGIAAKVVVDGNVNGRMGRTSRDICVGAFVVELQRCGSRGIPRRTRLASDRVVMPSFR